MSSLWLLGTAGIVAIEGSYLPQIARLFRLKKADEISYLFPALNFAGRIGALTYALAEGNAVFTIGFLVGTVLRLTLLVQVAWYRHQARRTPVLILEADRGKAPAKPLRPAAAGHGPSWRPPPMSEAMP